jgi:hypothetical protein
VYTQYTIYISSDSGESDKRWRREKDVYCTATCGKTVEKERGAIWVLGHWALELVPQIGQASIVTFGVQIVTIWDPL